MSEIQKAIELLTTGTVESLAQYQLIDPQRFEEALALLESADKEMVCPECKGVKICETCIRTYDVKPCLFGSSDELPPQECLGYSHWTCPACNGIGTKDAYYEKQIEELKTELASWRRISERLQHEKNDLTAENERLKGNLLLQSEAGQWANDTFGKGQTVTGVLNHLIKEIRELYDASMVNNVIDARGEAADCLLLLMQHAHELGYDLLEEAKKKHQINLKRKWGKPNEYGVIEHIKDKAALAAVDKAKL